VYNNIIEAQKRLREPLRPPNVDIARINERYVHPFYSVLSSDIRTLREGNDLSPAKMYEMIEKAHPEIEVKYRTQRAYTSSRRFPHYDSGTPLRGMNEKIKKVITASKSHMNNLTIIPFLVIQIVGVRNRE